MTSPVNLRRGEVGYSLSLKERGLLPETESVPSVAFYLCLDLLFFSPLFVWKEEIERYWLPYVQYTCIQYLNSAYYAYRILLAEMLAFGHIVG